MLENILYLIAGAAVPYTVHFARRVIGRLILRREIQRMNRVIATLPRQQRRKLTKEYLGGRVK